MAQVVECLPSSTRLQVQTLVPQKKKKRRKEKKNLKNRGLFYESHDRVCSCAFI
jgi:hypothetical protein